MFFSIQNLRFLSSAPFQQPNCSLPNPHCIETGQQPAGDNWYSFTKLKYEVTYTMTRAFILIGSDFMNCPWVCTRSSPHEAVCIRVLQPPLRVALNVQIIKMDFLRRQRRIRLVPHDCLRPHPFRGTCWCRTSRAATAPKPLVVCHVRGPLKNDFPAWMRQLEDWTCLYI